MKTRSPACGLPFAPLAALAALLLPGAPLANAPVDDFEAGPFSFSGFTDTPVPIPGSWSHAFHTERNIYLSGGSPQASLSVGPLFDDYMFLALGSGDFCRVEYVWGTPRDLSFAGSIDRIEVRIAGIPGTTVGATLTNGTSNVGVPAQPIPASGQVTLSFPIAQWAPGLTSVATGFWLYFQDSGEYLIYDIRFRGPGVSPTIFEGDFVAAQIPPVPSAALQFRALDTVSNPLYAAHVSIGDAMTDAQTVPGADWTWSEMSSLGGDVATLSLEWTDFGGILETEFDFQFDFPAIGGLLPEVYPPDPVHGPEGIALSFPVILRDGSGAVVRTSSTWLTFDFDEQQLGSLEFHDVSVTENPVARSWTDGFSLHFRMAFSGMNSPDMQFPLFHATWTSDWTSQVPTGVAEPAGAGTSGTPLRITAVPGITRGATEIRASRPFERAVTLHVHDVTGRRLRTLAAAPGTRAVRWDGRTLDGRAAAPGVYFVRGAGVPGAVTRVVRAGR